MLHPEDKINYYDVFIADLPPDEKEKLKEKIKEQWNNFITSDDEIDFLIGKKYYDLFDFNLIKNKHEFPFLKLERKGIMFITDFCYSRLKKERSIL